MTYRNHALSLCLIGGIALVASGCLAAGATVSHRPAPTVHHPPAKEAAAYRPAGRFEYRQVVRVETGRRWRRHFVDLDIRTQYRRRIRRAGRHRTDVDLRIEAIHLYANGRYLGSVRRIPGALSRVEATVDRRGRIRLNRDVMLIGSPDLGFELIATRHYDGFLYDHYRSAHGMKVGRLDLWRERVHPERRSDLFRPARFDGLVPISLLPDDVHFYDRYDWTPHYGPAVVYGGPVHAQRGHKGKPHHGRAHKEKPHYTDRDERHRRDEGRGTTARRGTVDRNATGRVTTGRPTTARGDIGRGTERSRIATRRRDEDRSETARDDRNRRIETREPETPRRMGTARDETGHGEASRDEAGRDEPTRSAAREGSRTIERTYETRGGERITVKRDVEFRRVDDDEPASDDRNDED